jgi:hypothetical protein
MSHISLAETFTFVKAADDEAFHGFSSGTKCPRLQLAQLAWRWRDRSRYLQISLCHAPRKALTHYILERAAHLGVPMSWREAAELARCCGHDIALEIVEACGENSRAFVELAYPLHRTFSSQEISIVEHWFFAVLRGAEPEYCEVHGKPLLERLFGMHIVGSEAHYRLNELVEYQNHQLDHGLSLVDRIAVACTIRGVQASVLAIERAAINVAVGYGAELAALVVNNPVEGE